MIYPASAWNLCCMGICALYKMTKCGKFTGRVLLHEQRR